MNMYDDDKWDSPQDDTRGDQTDPTPLEYTREHSLEGLGEYPDDFTQSYQTQKEGLDEDDVKRIVDKRMHQKRPRFRFLRALALILIGTILGSLLSPLVSEQISRFRPDTPETEAVASSNVQTIQIDPGAEPNIETAVAKKAAPSVVGVSTSVELRNSPFYGNQTIQGVGSGVVLTEDGYILTNSHVVSDGRANEVSVLFNDGTEDAAEVLWYDATLDLAILKVDRQGLIPAEIASSDDVQVGDKAIAIGNPLGLDLQSTLTSGYISGLNRSITLENGNTMDGLMQTDAAINSGNSGGALLDAQGRLIGINTAKNSVAEGIGFAIPIDTAKPVIDSIIETGTYTTPILGFRGFDYATFKRQNQIETGPDEGAIVLELVPGTPAADQLQRYDIIVSVDGEPVETMGSLKKILLGKRAGDSVSITVVRNDEEVTVEVGLVENTQ